MLNWIWPSTRWLCFLHRTTSNNNVFYHQKRLFKILHDIKLFQGKRKRHSLSTDNSPVQFYMACRLLPNISPLVPMVLGVLDIEQHCHLLCRGTPSIGCKSKWLFTFSPLQEGQSSSPATKQHFQRESFFSNCPRTLWYYKDLNIGCLTRCKPGFPFIILICFTCMCSLLRNQNLTLDIFDCMSK